MNSSDCVNCQQDNAEPTVPGYFAFSVPAVSEPKGRTRNIRLGNNDALLYPGRSYRIPFSGTGNPMFQEGVTVSIPTEGETARVYVHKAELTDEGAGVAVVTNLDAPVTASSVIITAAPGLQDFEFTDVVEFIGDFSFSWLAVGFLLGAFLIWSAR